MKQLFTIHNSLVENISLDFKRSLYDFIDWNARLVSIKGARGVGKTTILLQYIKSNYSKNEEALYVSLDNLYFSTNSLYELANEFAQLGGKHLYLDEVHKYQHWTREVKNIYDSIPQLSIVLTASSAVEITKGEADLSRRMVNYHLPGLSYREYLNFQLGTNYIPLTFENIIHDHKKIANGLLSSLKPLKHFETYLKHGYFPFFKEGSFHFNQKLLNTINLVLETDIPQIEQISIKSLYKLRQLLFIISQSVPFKPNISKLANRIGITRNTLLHYLYYLEHAEIISTLKRDSKGISLLSKPEKVYLQNTNLMYALSKNGEIDIGNRRETFFNNQISVANKVTYTDRGDFLINNKYTFEVGGKNKKQTQIKGIDDAFVVADDIEVGYYNNIPLWLFGFLY